MIEEPKASTERLRKSIRQLFKLATGREPTEDEARRIFPGE